MPLDITPFTDQHIDDAGAMLARRHAADRRGTPELSERFGGESATREVVARIVADGGTAGVVAVRGGRMAGFLLGEPALPPPTALWAGFVRPRSARVLYSGYAVEDDEPVAVYREMYAVLARQWVDDGLFSHYVETHALDGTALEAWYSLGFGQDIALAVRDTSPVVERAGGVASGLEIRQAGIDDFEDVMRLVDGLGRYHAGPPMYFPYPRETWADWRRYQEELLREPANAHWLAYRDGEAVGIQTFERPTFDVMARPEDNIYLFEGFTTAGGRGAGTGGALLRRSIEWAREAGYTTCTLHFLTANILGARFWLGNGFRPLTYRLLRQVDERIAWAR